MATWIWTNRSCDYAPHTYAARALAPSPSGSVVTPTTVMIVVRRTTTTTVGALIEKREGRFVTARQEDASAPTMPASAAPPQAATGDARRCCPSKPRHSCRGFSYGVTRQDN
jgi:hypothetical protein